MDVYTEAFARRLKTNLVFSSSRFHEMKHNQACPSADFRDMINSLYIKWIVKYVVLILAINE